MPILDADAIDALRARLIPAGTPLADVPLTYRGVRWHEYLEVWWADMRAAAYRESLCEAPAKVIPIASARDRYGWRSLPGGTPYFGR